MKVSGILYWGQENQQMLLTAGLCFLAAAILVAAIILYLLRSRYIARQKLKTLTQSAETESTRDYQVTWHYYFHQNITITKNAGSLCAPAAQVPTHLLLMLAVCTRLVNIQWRFLIHWDTLRTTYFTGLMSSSNGHQEHCDRSCRQRLQNFSRSSLQGFGIFPLKYIFVVSLDHIVCAQHII